VIDSHCHLNFDILRNNFDEIIINSKNNGLTSILTINTDPKEFIDHLNLIKKYKSIYISYGLHPANVNDKTALTKDNILLYCDNPKVIAIGETGLDFYHSIKFKKKQYEIFETHIEASINNQLPIIIHQRNSENEIIDVLKSYQKKNNLSVVFHCFTGSKKLLDFCLNNNFYISLSGIITFNNAKELREIIKNVSLDYLLIETDSPFLSPIPMRGKSNQPAYVRYIAQFLSKFFNISLNEFIEITDNNFYKLFFKAKRYNDFQ